MPRQNAGWGIRMSLISLGFLAFFICVAVVYYILPRRFQWVVLLIASFAFYLLCAKPYTIIYLLISVVSAFYAALYMKKTEDLAEKMQQEEKTADAEAVLKRRKTVFIITVVGMFLLLALLKYTNSLIGNVQTIINLLGINVQLGTVSWIASLGISFYTLQVVGYLADVYWGISSPQTNIFKFTLFVSYFPQITSGPISRYHQMENQLYAGHKFNYRTFTFGCQRILWGFFKKLVIAERVGVAVRSVYTPDAYHAGGIIVWAATILAAFQMYTDFSGSMDIILGVSECLGIRLPENFNTPFFSRTFQEFWQRWHITLGTWLKDYVMFPILKSRRFARMGKWIKTHWGKKAAKTLPTILAMFILWLANGVWHGAAWKYMAAAVWFFFMLAMGQLLAPLFNKITKALKINTQCFSWHLFQSLRTLVVYSAGLVFFMANSVMHGFSLIKSALTVFNPQMLFTYEFRVLFSTERDVTIAMVALVILFLAEGYMQNGRSLRKAVANQNLPVRWLCYLLLIFSIIIFGTYGYGYNAADFIYAGF